MVFITIMLCMFQAIPPPIIRSPKLYTQHRVFVELFQLLTAIVSELEPLCNVVSCWLYLNIYVGLYVNCPLFLSEFDGN
jgi:hypothetical protein